MHQICMMLKFIYRYCLEQLEILAINDTFKKKYNKRNYKLPEDVWTHLNEMRLSLVPKSLFGIGPVKHVKVHV